MSDASDELIKEIASKHHISVSKDDPILIMHTLNERLLQDSAKTQQELLDKFKAEIESIALRWENDAKTKAERILNAALNASQELMSKKLVENIETISAAVRKEIDAAIKEALTPVKKAKNVGIFNLTAAVITFLAACVVFLTVFFH